MTYLHHKISPQRGATLIELLVGITIGLFVIVVAMGTLVVSRGVSSTVSDASEIQEQASYVFRIIGRQLRQAGSLKLKLTASQLVDETIVTQAADPVAFEARLDGGDAANSFNPVTDSLSGLDSPSTGQYKLTTAYRNYKEPIFTSGAEQSQQRNCIGVESGVLIQSRFVLNTTTNELLCNDVPLMRNVANFQVRYLLQGASNTGSPTIQYVNAAAVAASPQGWPQVFGVEVCLVLFGNEPMNLPAGSTYTDCDGTTAIDMTTLTGNRKSRMHKVFRNVIQLRSQGLAG